MEVQVLGPVVLAGGLSGEVRLPGRRHRALLARLAAATPEAVSAGDLIDAVWGEQLPDDPAHALQHVVWGLRSAAPGGSDAVLRTAGGYRLDAAVWSVDSQVAIAEIVAGEAAFIEGDAATAHRRLARALRRWRGVPFGEFCDAPDLAAERERMEEFALRAREVDAEALLELGRSAEAAALVRWLAIRAPQRARVRALARRISPPGTASAPTVLVRPLTRAEHELAARLAVFEAAFGLADAEIVCGDPSIGASELRVAFSGLVAASVIEPAGARYSLARRPDGNAPGRIRAAHARWVCGLAPEVPGSAGVERVEDAVAALRHAALTDDAVLAARITAALGRCLDAAGPPDELSALLDVLDVDGEPSEDAFAARLLAAHLAAACGEGQRVDRHLQVAVTIASEGGASARGRTSAVASVLARQRRSPAAVALADRAVELLATTAAHEQAYALSVAAPAHLIVGEAREAMALARRAADGYDQLGDRQGLAWAITGWAQAESAGGAQRAASRRARDALALAADLGDDSAAARALEVAGSADARAGEVRSALACLAAAGALDRRRAGLHSRDLRRVASRAARLRRRLDATAASEASEHGSQAAESPSLLLAL